MTAKCPDAPPLGAFHLELRDGHFYDLDGNVVLLKGVNLGGSSKIPYETKPGSISFVNRPFPLEDADEHYSRLQRWGFNCLRFIVTWEAIEHKGPGIYDQDYLRYLRQVLLIARKYGMYIYIDPHQDAWSRWTGGDGAPLWTLVDLGLNPANFAVTKAALCQDTYGGRPDDFPKMIWPTNFFKFGCATMATLFWAGNKLAPGILMHGEPVQDFLQSHYTNAMVQVANIVADMDHVMGFGTMNEPCVGYIGVQDTKKHFTDTELKLGYAPTPHQGMCLANGIDKTVEVWSSGAKQYVFGRYDHREKVRVKGKRAWQDGVQCIWEMLGLYRFCTKKKKAFALKRNYFAHVDFGVDCYVPFATKYMAAIRKVKPDAILFVEMPPLEFLTTPFPKIKIPRIVNATHWYDAATLFFRTWTAWFNVDSHSRKPVFGKNRVRACHIRALASIKAKAKTFMQNAPTLIGECGIPFNLNSGDSYVTGDFQPQIDAMNNTVSALEANMLSYTLWCYTPDNNNKWGDLWNREDFSLYSMDQAKDKSNRDAGGRGKEGYVRPAAWKINGIPSSSAFDLETCEYALEYLSTDDNKSETIIFVPRTVHYDDGFAIVPSDGEFYVEHFDGYALVHYLHDPRLVMHTIVIKRRIDASK
ncbi:unnamed protein product [Aphanomyces euteiches]|uniref:Glycoside hydrolase family 5 domain-containing protein n=1 Tax=Aphanomyces euteiches TaxID=100861 RepID=A0A6G0XBS4_9STRA|nr:hypothetical protein Ae201684_006696 [Aphanomyces euteiches]KAH9141073.1 hypothetical protein AeRB84_014703 [Aphanomyces euteiches]